MLVGNRVKYLGVIFGVVFAAVLIAQQASIFCGLMSPTVSQIRDVEGASIWVMDKNVQFVDEIKPLADTELFRGLHRRVRVKSESPCFPGQIRVAAG
jgi:putative ABC transport system permease protein